MSHLLFQWVIVVGLYGLGESSQAFNFNQFGRGVIHVINGGDINRVKPGQNMPGVNFWEALPDILDGAVDLIEALDQPRQKRDEEQDRDEQESQWEQEEAEQEAQWEREEAERERERAERAEQEAQWQEQEAQRERERAEIAEQNEAAAREEAHQSRELAEEAKGAAQEAKGTAQEARGAAQEARGAAQEAKGTAQEAKGAAQEAKGAAQEAKGTAQEAKGTAIDAQKQVEEAHKRVSRQNTFVVLLALLTLLALGLALKKPRQAVARVAGNAIEPLSRSFKHTGRQPASGSDHAKAARVALTGFDKQGRSVNILLHDKELDPGLGGFTLGRHHLLVDKTLDDNRISKRHARFSYADHGVFVEDLNSSNGTIVNGTQPCPPFKPIKIRPGDTIRLGDIELKVSA